MDAIAAKLVENEAIFRKMNERFLREIEKLNKIAAEDEQREFAIMPKPEDMPLRLFCECADEKCTDRILLNFYTYNVIHKKRNRFVVRPGHDVPSVEKIVINHEPEYNIIEKLTPVPKASEKLNKMPLRAKRAGDKA